MKSRFEIGVGKRRTAYTCNGEGWGTPKSGAGGCAPPGAPGRESMLALARAGWWRRSRPAPGLPVGEEPSEAPTRAKNSGCKTTTGSVRGRKRHGAPSPESVKGWRRGTCAETSHNVPCIHFCGPEPGAASDAPILHWRYELAEALPGRAAPGLALPAEPAPCGEIKDRLQAGRLEHEAPNEPDHAPGRVAGVANAHCPRFERHR